jgi:hypothetical protein
MQNGSRRRGFADCVRTSAQSDEVVSACNREHGTDLRAPIEALLHRAPVTATDLRRDAELVCFIGFVHRRVWRKILTARRKRNWRVPKSAKGSLIVEST